MEIIESVSGPISQKSVQEKIMALENEWKNHPQVDIPVIHHYSGGMYGREITIPKDTLLTGRIYKDDHFDVMVYGDVTVSSDAGIKRLDGFNFFPSKKGKKRAGYTHEETRWITFCLCDQMPEDDYLDHLTVESFEDLDRVDYERVLLEYGFTEKVARRQSEDTRDRNFDSFDGVQVMKSNIEGVGLFAKKPFEPAQLIIPARIDGLRTDGGRYTNHSATPNAIMMQRDGNVYLFASQHIENEEITIDYRQSLGLQIKQVRK